MKHRFIETVRPALLGALAVAAWQPAAAEVYTFEGTMSLCTGICSSFAALGAPTGGVGNMTPSNVTGYIEIDVAPNGAFTDANVVEYGFEIYNNAVGIVPASFTGATFNNPTTANPLPLDGRVVSFNFVPGFDNFPTMIFGGSGTTGPNNELASGLLVATFTVPPFNPNGAQVYFDFSGAPTQGWLFGGLVQFTEIDSVIEQLPGAISVADNPTAFPDTAIGAGVMRTVTVTNVLPAGNPCSNLATPPIVPDPLFDCTGNGGPLTIVSVAGANPLAPPFSIFADNCTGVTLAQNASCTIDLSFNPTAAGMRTDSFGIVSDAGSVTVNVSGTGLEPNIQVTPVSPLNFVSTTTGSTSQRIVTIKNTGLAALALGDIDFSQLDPQFSVALNNCSLMTLVANAMCTVTLEFAPDAEGLFMSVIGIPSNDPDTPLLNYTIQGEGIIGTIAGITVIPGALLFDEVFVGDMAELPIEVESSGNDPLDLISFELSGPNAAEFDQTTNDCPASLDSGTSCFVNVVFTPLSGGPKSATLTIESNGAIRPILNIAITATAFDGPRIEVDPTALQFGSGSSPVDVGSTTNAAVTVWSVGTQDLNVGQIGISGMDAAEFMPSNGCTAPVPPQGSCTITVDFTPVTDADKSAQLDIESDDDDNSSVPVALTGFVFRGPRVDVPAGTVDVDQGMSVELGQTRNFNLVVGNSGTQDLQITELMLGGEDAEEFSFNGDECLDAGVPVPVPPQGSCTIRITFAPATAGEKSAELSIVSNDVTQRGASQTTVVPLSATATAPPPPPPPAPPGSQTVQPPGFALADPGGGSLGFGLLGLGALLWLVRRRYR